jgi:hypothetical protein
VDEHRSYSGNRISARGNNGNRNPAGTGTNGNR